MSNKLNIELKQGEDFYRLITIKDNLSAEIDLTGYSFTGQIRASSKSELFLSFTFTIKDQGTSKGQVEMTLADAVWNKKLVDNTETGSFGLFVQKLLTLGKYLGLK